MATNVLMPQLGESVVEGTIGKWFKKAGDKVDQYEPLMEVITDKVTTEIPSPAAGTILEILVPDGTTVNAGVVLATIGAAGEQPPGAAAAGVQPPGLSTADAHSGVQPPDASPTSAAVAQESQPVADSPAAPAHPGAQPPLKRDGGSGMRLTPVVARMIAEYNISSAELQNIQGSGEGGRVSKKDLEKFIQSRGRAPAPASPPEPELAPWEQPGSGDLFGPTDKVFAAQDKARSAAPARPAATPPGPGVQPTAPAAELKPGPNEELVPLTPMRRAIAEHMVRSVRTSPHVTTIHEVDMTRVIAHLKAHGDEFQRQGARLTYTAYLVDAAIAALRAMPVVNAVFTEQGILMKRDLNVGIAVAIPDGLIVPVVKNSGDKSLLGLARAVHDLSTRARDKKLTAEDMQGGTFTITNYGIFGSLFGTPVINQPQSAILGIGAIQKRVVVIDDAIAIRPMVYMGLTFDHRLLDGETGDRFMGVLKKHLENYPA